MRIRTIRGAAETSLGAQVNLTAKAFTTALAARLPDGWTTPQVAVLTFLSQHPGSPQRTIAAGTGIDTATLAEMLKRLEARGMVRREPDPQDARRLLVSIGDIDDQELLAAIRAAGEVNEVATRDLTEADITTLWNLLARLRANLEPA